MAAARAGEPTDGFAWIRAGHAAVAHRNQLLVLGGTLVRDGRKTAELLVLNTDTMGWRVRRTAEGCPEMAGGHRRMPGTGPDAWQPGRLHGSGA